MRRKQATTSKKSLSKTTQTVKNSSEHSSALQELGLVNKKVKNAKKVYNEELGITFDSILEANCYRWLTEFGIKFDYNTDKSLVYFKGVPRPTLEFYEPSTRSVKHGTKHFKYKIGYGSIMLNREAIRDKHYTPDFIVYLKDGRVLLLEAKGNETDQWQLRVNIIRAALEDTDYVFAIIKTKTQLKDLLKALNEID